MVLTACPKPRGAAPFNMRQDLGVAEVKAEGACLAIANANLAVGQAIHLVSASQPALIGKAEISGKSDRACTPEDQNQPGLTHYQFKMTSGSLPNAVPAFALVNFTGTLVNSDAGVTAYLNGDGRPSTYRYCTSTEGIHLTVWDGKPLASRRTWHSYYYLGYDVDPTCTAA